MQKLIENDETGVKNSYVLSLEKSNFEDVVVYLNYLSDGIIDGNSSLIEE